MCQTVNVANERTIAVENEIRTFLAQNFPLGDDPSRLASDASLIEAGIIDSTGVLELVGFLEENYRITIADEELLPENLDTIENIVGFLQGKAETAPQAVAGESV
jgi:acyl carrier protein